MSTKPEDIPQDVWDMAVQIADELGYSEQSTVVPPIARGIRAERVRCAERAAATKFTAYPASLTSDEMAPFQSGADAMRDKIVAALLKGGA